MMGRNEHKRLGAPTNWAEFLYDVGRGVRRQIRCGAGIEDVSRKLHATPECCRLALAFANASDLVKFRAMVEDWSPDHIASEVGRPHAAEAAK